MKRTFIITAPIVVIVIAVLGYASNLFNERYYWGPKYRFTKVHVPDFEYNIDQSIPFLTIVESTGTLNGKFTHERWVVFQLFGFYGKALSYKNSAH
jgi:hypothetical protein